MLQVCHLISGDLWAGAEVMACHLIKGLNELPGLSLYVLLLNEGRLANELRSAGVRVQVLDESRSSFFQLARNISRLLAAQPLDIIHSHRYKENLLAYFVSQKLPDIKLVSTQHGLPESWNSKPSLAGRLKTGANFQVLKRCFDAVVGGSDDIKSFFISYQLAVIGVLVY